MEKEIGTVISGIDSPSPSALDFVVNQGVVHRGQFVELDYSEGTMICLVTDVFKTNRYFERAESVKEFESSGAKLFEQFPTAEWEYLVAKTRPLGVFKNGITNRATLPPGPGTRVRIASNENLKIFFHFSEEGLFLGNVENHDLPVKISMNTLLKKHVALLATSGAGKSHCASVIFEELLDRKKEAGRIGIIVFDPHGEYSSFADRAPEKGKTDYSGKTILVKAMDIKIGVPKLSVNALDSLIKGLSPVMKRELGKILADLQKKMRSGKGPFDLLDLKEAISNSEINENTKGPLLAWISELQDLNLFGKTDNPGIFDLVQPGKLTVIDLSELIDLRKKQIIVSYISKRLFYARREKAIPPFLLVLEEAHQFCPQQASEEMAICRSIIQTIAREGRKFGASLCLISQRPIQLSTTVLAQCNTQIILRITNPYDLKHIGESSEGLDSRSLDMITSLRVGEALIVGEATHYPLFFKVRQRKSAESRHEMPLEKAALDFETGKEDKKKEIEEFL
ncbi:MAG: ATP-binding protein [Candidatus ainarchaeum sp.]|nr:ATP-binding protein [Candidatus ainarchaeum sp.]